MDAVPAGLPEAGILEADLAQLHRAVLSWYDSRGRRLGFRSTRDPYAVLVSEVMLQQTQVSRVEQAWPRFLARFPTLGTLAEASIGDVLRAWSGLGYSRRALNLHRLARVVLAEHGGRLPADIGALERLPGIGRYTARAVAAIAFGRPVGPIDTNVRRVIGRARGSALGPAIGPASAPARAELQAVCDDLVPNDRLGYRIAFIESFRNRGIYPHDVKHLAPGSLFWEAPPLPLGQGKVRIRHIARQGQWNPGPFYR